MSSKELLKDYIPFGEEWKKEMRKFSKDKLIDRLRSKLITAKSLPKEISAEGNTSGEDLETSHINFAAYVMNNADDRTAKQLYEQYKNLNYLN